MVSCVWLFSARKAAEVISPGARHSRSRAWVWLGWWVPIVSLWFPVPGRPRRPAREHGARHPALGLWWALWITLTVLSGSSGLTPLGGFPSDGQLDALAWTEGLYTLVMLAAFGLWARLVWEVREAQRALLG